MKCPSIDECINQTVIWYGYSTEYYSTSKKKQNIHTHEQFKNYSQNKNNNSSFNKIEKRMTSIEKEIKELNNKMDFFFNNYNDNKENNINIKNKSLLKTVLNKLLFLILILFSLLSL